MFGLPEAITGDLAAQRAQARVDDYFELILLARQSALEGRTLRV